MPTQRHNQWELQTRLHPEERENPYLVLIQLFSSSSLEQLHSHLWNLLKASITGNFRGLPAKEQLELLRFYERMEKLLEASLLIFEQKTGERKEDSASLNNALNREAIAVKGEETLLPVIERVVSITGAEKIFFIALEKETAATIQKNLFLLVVLPDNKGSLPKEYQELIQAASIDLAIVTAVFITASALSQVLINGHIFYSVHCSSDNLLYNATSPLPQITSLPVQPIVTGAREGFVERFCRADAFLNGARYFYMQNENELSAFLLHQAVEQSYLSLLTTLIGNEENIHDLYQLRRLSIPLTQALNRVFSIADEKENRLLSLLQDAYQDARYNKDFKVADSDLEILLSKGEQLVQIAQAVFEEQVKAFEANFGVEFEK